MKAGRTLEQLAKELSRQRETRKDFVAPTSALHFKTDTSTKLEIDGQGSFAVSDWTHSQVAEKLDIPIKYYKKLQVESPEALDYNVNLWLAKNPKKQMIRTLDGEARAFLSDRYRPFDNYELAESVLDSLYGANCEVISCEVTDKNFYLKAVSPKVTHEIAKDDVVQAGIVISNSEIGAASLKVEPLIYRLVCTNGMISVDSSFRRSHLGAALGNNVGQGAIEFFSDATRKITDAAVFAQIKDIVAATLTDEGFLKITEKFRKSKEQLLQKDPFEVVEVVQKKYALSDTHGRGILTHLIEGREMNKFGLVNAVTRYSQDITDYDTATDFERLGGQILESTEAEWREISA